MIHVAVMMPEYWLGMQLEEGLQLLGHLVTPPVALRDGPDLVHGGESNHRWTAEEMRRY